MFKNYLKIAWRNMQKNKVFTFINLSGLTISLISVMLISLYISYELSYDKYLPQSNRIFRVYSENKILKENNKSLMLPMGLGETLQKEFPEISASAELRSDNIPFTYQDKTLKLDVIRSGEQFFNIFPFGFLKGDPQTALKTPQSIVISETTAKKFFGGTDVINKTISSTNGVMNTITGVVKDIPANTHFKADAFTYETKKEVLSWQAYSSIYHYLLLNRGADPQQLEQKFAGIYKKYQFPENTIIQLQPVADIHLHSSTSEELEANSDIRYIYIFACAAILILLVASINYVNLSTARLMHRAREVGVRKVLGAVRKDLIFQFLGETLIFFSASFIMAAGVTWQLYPLFAQQLRINPDILSMFNNSGFLLFLAAVLFFVILAGIYPAIYLSGQAPAFVIKGFIQINPINRLFKKALVVFQFVVCVFFIIATLTVYRQLRYIQNKNLGFDKEHLLVLPFHNYEKQYGAFKNTLQKDPGIDNIAIAGWNPGIGYGGSGSWESENDSTQQLSVDFVHADLDFISTLKLQLIEGRLFSEKFAADTLEPSFTTMSESEWQTTLYNRSIIINEAAVKQLGIKNPVGKQLKYPALQGTVIGVIKDFNGLSLHHAVTPIAISASSNSNRGYVFIRINPGNTERTLAYIKKQWQSFYPKTLFEISFVDDSMRKLYTTEKRLAGLFSAFAFLGILIACMGLFGLVTFLAEQRTKEIGIRKVMGASIGNITTMLTKDFLKPILFAALLTFPIAWYAMNQWLQNFAYRINMEWWVFVLAGTLAVLIALLTVSFQAIKAALANPVKSLRTE